MKALGKTEVVIALHTSNAKAAAEAARRESVRFDIVWKNHREALKRGEVIDPDREVTDIELKRAVAGKFWKREQAATALPNEDDIRENIEQDIALFEDKDPSAEATLLAQARAIVRETGLKIKLPTDTRIGQPAPEFQASSDLTKLIGLFRRADVEHLKRALDRMSGRYGDHAHDPLFQDINSVSPPPAVGEGVALGEAIQRIEIDPVRAHLGDTAEAKYVVTFRTMKEVLGTDRPLGADDHL